jgi:hypothetical protein
MPPRAAVLVLGVPDAAVPVETRLALRVDLTRRAYLAAGETYPFWSIGFSLPAVAPR